MTFQIQSVLFKVTHWSLREDQDQLNRYYEIFTNDMKLQLCAPWYVENGWYVFPVADKSLFKQLHTRNTFNMKGKKIKYVKLRMGYL